MGQELEDISILLDSPKYKQFRKTLTEVMDDILKMANDTIMKKTSEVGMERYEKLERLEKLKVKTIEAGLGLGGAVTGASLGATFGPVGAAIGGIAGAIGGGLVADKYVVPSYIDSLEKLRDEEKFKNQCKFLQVSANEKPSII